VTLRNHDEAVRRAGKERDTTQRQLTTLTGLAMPKDVPSLADELHVADEEIARLADEIAQREDEEHTAEEGRTELGDKTALTQALEAHVAREWHTAELGEVEAHAKAAGMQATRLVAEFKRVEEELRQAKARRDQIRDAHVALDLAHRLAVGEPCPVCLRPVAELPRHREPADLADAGREIGTKETNLIQLRSAHREAEVEAAKLQQKSEEIRDRLTELAPQIDAHPDRSELTHRLAAIESADQQVRKARAAIRAARNKHKLAMDTAVALRRKAEQGWRDLDQARDKVVVLGAPPLNRDDLHRAWITLLTWRDQAVAQQEQTLVTLTKQLDDAERVRDEERASLTGRLERDGMAVPAKASPEQISEAVTTATARAEAHVEQVRANREHARELDEQARSYEQEAHIAHELTLVLRANNFEKWLCEEALDLLVTTASETLRDLSVGQYELVLGAKGDIEVVDYAEAGMRRSVRTLSGGETFQAALALALALSSQVAGLAATAARSLDSIFLDEGFGTLDPATLDTVAITLEHLAAGGDRMVGIVTHIPALADRVPVRFEVTRDSSGSHLTRAVT